MQSFFSPAKLNLFLRVLGKRVDGYHELASLFQAVDLGDHLEFCFSLADRFTCSDQTLLNPDNLVLKALTLFRRKTGFIKPVHIHLKKKIPMQSGLGGGSSNAATTLFALNSLHGFPFAEKQLSTWSQELGSDVPFFFSHGTAYCTGRGEQVRDLPKPPAFECLIVKPNDGLSTPKVFAALDLRELEPRDPEKSLQQFYQNNLICFNDLEKPALAVLPSLMAFKNTLIDQGYSHVQMTGSGSAFFCLGRGKKVEITNHFRQKVNSLNRSENKWYCN